MHAAHAEERQLLCREERTVVTQKREERDKTKRGNTGKRGQTNTVDDMKKPVYVHMLSIHDSVVQINRRRIGIETSVWSEVLVPESGVATLHSSAFCNRV